MGGLRVAIVSPSFYPVLGGVSEHVHHTARELVRRGHDVTVVTGAHRGGFEIGTQPYRVRRLGETLMVPANGGHAAVVWSPGLARALRALWRESFDLAHVHSPLEPGLPLEVLRGFPGPIVATFHSAGREPLAYRVLRKPLVRALARVRLRVAVSPAAREFVERVFPGDYRIVPNGVDLERFRVPARRLVPPRRLLAVGRFEPRKGAETLLRALALCHRERTMPNRPAWNMVWVGDGPIRERSERTARREGLPIRFVGAVAPSRMPSYFADADAFLAPATSGESFGVVLLEALAAGLPILASALPGYRSVLQASEAADLVAPGDVSAWANAIGRMLEQTPEEWARRSRAATRAAIPYAWPRVVDVLESIYCECVEPSATYSVTSTRAEAVRS